MSSLCIHDKLKRKHDCIECNGCPHGKRKQSCKEFNPCPHGKLKHSCI